MFWEVCSDFAPGPHTAGSTYGRVMTSGVGVVVEGTTLLGADIVEEVPGAESVDGGEVASVDGGVLGVASFASEQPAATVARAASPTTIERARTRAACTSLRELSSNAQQLWAVRRGCRDTWIVILKETPVEEPSVFTPASGVEREPEMLTPQSTWWTMGVDQLGR